MAESLVPQWTATGVVEAPLERVVEVVLTAEPGPGKPVLLTALPGIGRIPGVSLSGGPDRFGVHYGRPDAGGVVEIDRGRRMFAFQGGFKFRGELWFDRHERGTLVTYKVSNVAPESGRNNPMVRFQFWLAGRLRLGMRRILRTVVRAITS